MRWRDKGENPEAENVKIQGCIVDRTENKFS